MNTAEQIKQQLAVLHPQRIEVIDESRHHAGHAGSKSGGHYKLVIVSSAFVGKPMLGRHRMIYDTLKNLMQTAIHALTINALTPEEDDS